MKRESGMMRVLVFGGSGYVGSVLVPHLEAQGLAVSSVDWNRGRGGEGRFVMSYREVKESFLAEHNAIILLAGHSSVQRATADPKGAFTNNLVGFYELLEKIKGQRFVYASTSAIYSDVGATEASESWRGFEARNLYDLTKFTCDQLAAISGKDYYGLRLGTVNGWSPAMRWDLMINQMTQAAADEGVIAIANPSINRPILGLGDLCRAVVAILVGPKAPGLYNLASFNSTVLEIGQAVGKLLGVPVVFGSGAPGYDFRIGTRKFCETYSFNFQDTVETIVASLTRRHMMSPETQASGS